MALLSLEMIREIRGVTDAYAARERVRVGAPAQQQDSRATQPRRTDGPAGNNR